MNTTLTLRFVCPNCQAAIRVVRRLAGSAANCLACGAPLRVPYSDEFAVISSIDEQSDTNAIVESELPNLATSSGQDSASHSESYSFAKPVAAPANSQPQLVPKATAVRSEQNPHSSAPPKTKSSHRISWLDDRSRRWHFVVLPPAGAAVFAFLAYLLAQLFEAISPIGVGVALLVISVPLCGLVSCELAEDVLPNWKAHITVGGYFAGLILVVPYWFAITMVKFPTALAFEAAILGAVCGVYASIRG